jgi:hypothetical protein
MSAPTRYLSGVATVPSTEPLGGFPLPDPFHSSGNGNTGTCVYANDFDTLIGSDYTITGTSSTFALGNLVGGVGVLTPGGTTTTTVAYKNGQFFQFQAGNHAWYLCRILASAFGTGSFYFGLQAGSSANDGIWFSKPASSTSLNLVSVVGGTSTTLVTSVETVAAGTYIDVGFEYNGTDIKVYANDAVVARVTAPTVGTTITSAILTPVFEITPTAGETLTVDYVLTACEVTR